MKRLATMAVAAALVLSTGTLSAYADACSGRSHDTETALGAGSGALVGGLASHSIGGAIVGGVAGGFIGNAIGRSNDCHRHYRHYRRERDSYYIGRDGHRHRYYR